MRRWLRPGIAVAVVCAVSAAAWLGAQPVLTAALKRQLPQIQAAATAAIGSDVRLGEIDVHLAWPVPELRVSSVEIRDPEDQSVVLAIGRVSARLDLAQSWKERALRFGAIRLGDARLVIRERGPGRWSLEILRRLRSGLAAPAAADGAAPTWIVPQWDLGLEALTVAFVPWEGPERTLKVDQAKARVLRSAGAWKIEPAWAMAGALRAQASLEGDSTGSWKGDVSLKGGHLREWLGLMGPLVLKEGLLDWLNHAIRGGELTVARMHLPSDPLMLSLGFKGLELNYQTGWPVLTGMAGQVQLRKSSLDIAATQGQAPGITVRNVTARVEDLSAEGAVVQVTGGVTAEEQAVRSFLESGPFRRDAAPVMGQFHPSGPSKFSIRLSVPLGAGDPTGIFRFESAGVHVEALKDDFRDLQGTLSFDERSFKFTDFQGVLLGEHAEFDGEWYRSAPDDGKAGPRAQFRGQARAKIERLAPLAPTWPVEKFFQGSAALKAKADYQGGEWTIHASSGLAGVRSLLPMPLTKESEREVRADVEGRWASDGSLKSLALGWADDGAGDPTRKVDLKLTLDAKPSLLLEGKLGAFSIEGASDLARVWSERPKDKATDGPGLQWQVRLWLDELRWKAERWVGMRIRGDGQAGARGDVSVDSFDLKGRVNWEEPLPQKTLRAEFEKVHFSDYPWRHPPGFAELTPEEAEAEYEASAKDAWDLSRWPGLSLRLRGIRVADQELGTLGAEIRQTGQALESDHFLLAGPELELSVSRLQSRYGGDKPTSSAEGRLTIKKTSFAVKKDSVQAIEIDDSRSEFKLSWPGGPDRFAVRRLSGNWEGRAESGTLTGVHSTLFRVLNGLNLHVEDSRQGISRFTQAWMRIGFESGILQLDPVRAIFGNTYVRLTGREDARREYHDGVDECPRLFTPEVDDDAEEPGCTPLIGKTLKGPWKEKKD